MMSNFCKRMRFFSLITFTGHFFQILYSLFRHRLKTEISKFSNENDKMFYAEHIWVFHRLGQSFIELIQSSHRKSFRINIQAVVFLSIFICLPSLQTKPVIQNLFI